MTCLSVLGTLEVTDRRIRLAQVYLRYKTTVEADAMRAKKLPLEAEATAAEPTIVRLVFTVNVKAAAEADRLTIVNSNVSPTA